MYLNFLLIYYLLVSLLNNLIVMLSFFLLIIFFRISTRRQWLVENLGEIGFIISVVSLNSSLMMSDAIAFSSSIIPLQ